MLAVMTAHGPVMGRAVGDCQPLNYKLHPCQVEILKWERGEIKREKEEYPTQKSNKRGHEETTDISSS